jgi:ribosome-associated protein
MYQSWRQIPCLRINLEIRRETCPHGLIMKGNCMEIVTIKTEYIKLDQLLKWAGMVNSGAEAKEMVQTGCVKVNGNTELQRGKKIRKGDKVLYNGTEIEIG